MRQSNWFPRFATKQLPYLTFHGFFDCALENRTYSPLGRSYPAERDCSFIMFTTMPNWTVDAKERALERPRGSIHGVVHTDPRGRSSALSFASDSAQPLPRAPFGPLRCPASAECEVPFTPCEGVGDELGLESLRLSPARLDGERLSLFASGVTVEAGAVHKDEVLTKEDDDMED